jgi:hypothetical protein
VRPVVSRGFITSFKQIQIPRPLMKSHVPFIRKTPLLARGKSETAETKANIQAELLRLGVR